MCIRDRPVGPGASPPAVVRPDPGHRLPADGVAGVQRGAGPVSYTHLRAHETVLDLVCRLLLEKKKTYTYNTAEAITTQHADISLLIMYDAALSRGHTTTTLVQ